MTKERPTFPLKLDALESKKNLANRAVPATPSVNARANAPKKLDNPARAVGTSAQTFESPSGLGLDSSTVREHMVRKLAQQGIEDNVVLSAMLSVERHRFVDTALVNQAYEDTSLPIGSPGRRRGRWQTGPPGSPLDLHSSQRRRPGRSRRTAGRGAGPWQRRGGGRARSPRPPCAQTGHRGHGGGRGGRGQWLRWQAGRGGGGGRRGGTAR